MVTEEPITREALRERDREERIRRALVAGDHDEAEWLRTLEYDDETTPEEDAEDTRVSMERLAKGKFITLEEAERKMDELFPEDAAFFRRLDEEFPDWETHLGRRPSHSPESAEFYKRLSKDYPEAVSLFETFFR